MSPSSSTMMLDDDDMQENVFAKKGCFCTPFFGKRSKTSQNGLGWWKMQRPETKEHWWVKGWSKIREWSEVVAVRQWKTFIRGFNKNRKNGYIKQGSFRYDPHSYARNFDDGTGENRDEDYGYDFSSRYASVPASAKSSMDLGKDGPSFM